MKLIKFQRPSLSNWPGTGRIADLRDEIDRLFEPSVVGFAPALDVHEDKDNFIVKIELPGVKKEDVNVSLHDGSLTISGERRSETTQEDAEVYHTERFFGRFQRTISLPATVAADKVKAQYRDGVLTITLPKTEEAKPKQIDISVN